MNSDLSDNQKRFICRMLFLLFCALPTCVTIYFATHKRTASQWAQLLQAELGIETSIGAVETPTPDQFVFHDVRLYGNNSEPIFESLNAKVTLGNVNRIEFNHSIQITRKSLSHFFEEASERLVKTDSDSKPWEVVFNDIEVISRRESEFDSVGFPMNRLFVTLNNGRDGKVLTLESPLVGTTGQRSEDRGQLQISRNRQTGRFHIVLNTTNRGSVPCWLARHWFPELEKRLGPDAEFSGVAEIDCSQSDVRCMLTGNFSQIQLDQPNSQRVSSIRVSGWKFENSRWTQIAFDDNQLKELNNLRPESSDHFDATRRTALSDHDRSTLQFNR